MVAGKTGRLLSCFVSIAMVLALVPAPALAEVADEVAPYAMGAGLAGEGEGQDVPADPIATAEEPTPEEAWDEEEPTGDEELVVPDQGEVEEDGEAALVPLDQPLEVEVVTDDAAPGSVYYIERTWDEEGNKIVETMEPSPEDTQYFPSSTQGMTLEPGWYYLDKKVTINGSINIVRDTSLILSKDAKLDVKGLFVEWGETLTIYNQEGVSGEIYSHPDSGAGIGSSDQIPGGNVIIKGGTITAKGAKKAAGIGSYDGDGGYFGCIKIYGGKVTATGGEHGAGIGGGNDSGGDDVDIYGGEITATGGNWGAGIGGGDGGDFGNMDFYGGTITAKGGGNGAGIGGGKDGVGGRLTIYGGTITATGGDDGAGIGCGEDGNGTVQISGGTVHAYNGGNNGAAIGGANDADGGTITIDGGEIWAHGEGENGAAIGGGEGEDGGTITIAGGTIHAFSRDGAGIGGGDGGDGGTINISGGEIHIDPINQGNGAGIGGGQDGDGGKITITGGTIYANGKHGAGIGGGRASWGPGQSDPKDSGAGGRITITGGYVEVTSTNAFGIGAGGQDGHRNFNPDGVSNRTGSAGTITIGGDAQVRTYGRPGGIGGDSGRITIKENCDVFASGHLDEKYGCGVLLISRDGDAFLTISGGRLVAEGLGESAGIRLRQKFEITGGTLIAHGPKKAFDLEKAFGYYDHAKFMVGSSEEAAEAVMCDSRASVWKSGKKYVSISPCDHASRDAQGLCPYCWDQTYPVKYVERSWDGKKIVEEEKPSPEGTTAFPESTTVNGGWYYLNRDITINKRVSLTGDTHLILGDNHTLDVKGIYIPRGSTLTIYGQNVDSKNDTGRIYSHPSDGTAIGAYKGHLGGDVVIQGGTVEATGYDHCAGIGSNDGDGGNVGSFTMYGGTVTATGGSNGAGVGGGRECDSGKITIYGGTLTATGKNDSAGIGGGDSDDSKRGNASSITINGGTVTAKCGGSGAAIGGADYGTASVGIYGGTVTATCTGKGKGIGGGAKKPTDGSSIVLGYTPATQKDISITASSYGGTVTLMRPFRSGEEVFESGIAKNGKIAGKTLVAAAEPEPTEPTFRTHSLLLDGAIGARFFMELPEIEGVDYATSFMEFGVAGRGGRVTTDPFDAGDTNAAGTYYGFTCHVSSIQMADTITATFHYTQGEEEKTVSQEYSIAQYVREFDRVAGSFDDATVGLVHALADYGHYAQPYLSAVHGWAIGSDYAEMFAESELVAADVEDVRAKAAGYAVQAELPVGGEVLSASVGLDLTSDTVAYLSVTTRAGVTVASATLADGTPLELVKVASNRWRALIPGIMAHHLGDRFDVVVTTSGGTTVKARLAAVSLAQAMFDSKKYGSDSDALRMVAALWRYWEAADAYMEAHPLVGRPVIVNKNVRA